MKFDLGIATLSTYDEDGYPTVQIDAYGEENSGVAPYEHHSPHGLLTRCHDPETDDTGNPTVGCAVLYGLEGGRGHAWLCSDPRIIPLLPPLRKGGLCAYGGKKLNPSFYNIDGETGSQTFYVPYKIVNGTATKAMSIEINVDEEGEESISIVHGSGAALTIIESGGETSVTIRNSKGDAYVEVNAQGVVVNGTLTVQGGISAGGAAGVPTLPLTLAPPLIAVLNQIIGVIGATAAAIPAGGGAPIVPMLPPISGAITTIAAKNTKGM